MEQIRFDNDTIARVERQQFLFSDVVIAHTDELVPRSASNEHRLQAMRLVRDALKEEIDARHTQRLQNLAQFENMTKNVRPERQPYFVQSAGE